MKLPRVDTPDGLVIMAIAGYAAAVNGIAMMSAAWAWIFGGAVLVGWAIWRLSRWGS